MDPVIDIDHVSVFYGETPVLTNVSLTVYSGEFLGLIGPNGGGKTTLLRVIMGLLKPSSGNVAVFSERIGYVPQSLRYDRLFPISLLELVLSGCLSSTRRWGPYRQKDKKKALEALERVHLAEFHSKAFGELSGGQIQRALIARALVSEPDLLLLDEPTANVDLEAEAEIYKLIQELSKNTTILMVTHDLQAIISQVQKVICVQREVQPILPEEVCEHFALGLYHKPLLDALVSQEKKEANNKS